MNKRFSKLTALFLSLVMALSLAVPAFADDTPPISPGPGTEQDLDQTAEQEWLAAHPEEYAAFDPYAYFAEVYYFYDSPQEYMDDRGMTPEEFEQDMLSEWVFFQIDQEEQERKRSEWLTAHPEEAAAFDPYAYFAGYNAYYDSAQEFMDDWEMTPEEFREEMLGYWVDGRIKADETRKQLDEYLARHPDQAGAFDAEAYFAAAHPWYDSSEEYREDNALTQEEFETDMLAEWLEGQLAAERQEQEIAQFKADYPEEYAAFDPYSYFAKEYYYYDSPQEFMDLLDLTEEEFQDWMFREWMEAFLERVLDKELAGGSAKGINVMVDGKCVSFPDARPELVNGRTMAPLRAIMEALGAEVVYNSPDDIRCAAGGFVYTFAVGSNTVTVRPTTEDTTDMPQPEDIVMDCVPCIKDGRVYVPVRFFAEAFGYEVLWDQEYQTAVLLDRQGLTDDIDQDFTLLNRVLYAASAADQIKEGQATEQAVRFDLDLTLFDTLHGDKKIPVQFSGSALASDKAMELHLSGDLSSLIDYLDSSGYLYLEEQEIAQLRTALSDFSADVILNLELGAIYYRCPSLALISSDLLEGDPDAWFGIPVDLSQLSELTQSLGSLPQPGTVGQIITQAAGDSPFHLWSNAISAAAELEQDVGDHQFAKSGDGYTLSFKTTEYSWSGGEQVYTLTAVITPSGEKSCTYSVTFNLTSDNMVLDADLTGSSGKADLNLSFHLKNTFKFTLEGTNRTSGSDKAPLSAPPAGSKIEFPAGPIGSGSL